MNDKNKKKLIIIALAILIPVLGLVVALLYLKFFHKKDITK